MRSVPIYELYLQRLYTWSMATATSLGVCLHGGTSNTAVLLQRWLLHSHSMFISDLTTQPIHVPSQYNSSCCGQQHEAKQPQSRYRTPVLTANCSVSISLRVNFKNERYSLAKNSTVIFGWESKIARNNYSPYNWLSNITWISTKGKKYCLPSYVKSENVMEKACKFSDWDITKHKHLKAYKDFNSSLGIPN